MANYNVPHRVDTEKLSNYPISLVVPFEWTHFLLLLYPNQDLQLWEDHFSVHTDHPLFLSLPIL